MIILLSIFIFPISYLGVNFLYYVVIMQVGSLSSEEFYRPNEIEKDWEVQVTSLERMPNHVVKSHLKNIDEYPESNIFWISDKGKLLMSKGPTVSINKNWDVSSTIKFMKEEQDGKYFTTLSYLEGKENSGYVLLQVPQSYMGSRWEVLRDRYSFVWFIALGLIWVLFVFVSWVFFNKISKRLVKMQKSMETNENQIVPSKLRVERNDEIGQLEHSFNRMVDQLNDSREREKNEERIRKRLIANLSHDLRTPLSIINGHAHKLNQHDVSAEVKESLIVINEKVDFIAELIDNLFSFSVLSEGKLPMHKQSIDIVKVVRSSFIAWHPIFEELGFDIDVDLNQPIQWDVDEMWLRRILDNIFQNIQRHAREGIYISIQTTKEKEVAVLKIQDHGPGMESSSKHSGAGIGLSMVDMMLQNMNLNRMVSTDSKGTTVTILPMYN